MSRRLLGRARKPDGTRVTEATLTREMASEMFPELTDNQLDSVDWPLRIEMRPWSLGARPGEPDADD